MIGNHGLDVNDSLERLQAYHTRLWFELRDLIRLYATFCANHQEQTEAAVARALLFLFFGAMETSVRVLASACLLISKDFSGMSNADAGKEPEDTKDIPPHIAKYLDCELVRALTQAEELYIREQEIKIQSKDFREVCQTRFQPFEDRLVGVPTIYGRLFGFELRIDKSTHEWQLLRKLKTLRDIGAHGNLKKNPSGRDFVTREDLNDLFVARKWFCQQLCTLPWLARTEAEGEIKAIGSLLPLLERK